MQILATRWLLECGFSRASGGEAVSVTPVYLSVEFFLHCKLPSFLLIPPLINFYDGRHLLDLRFRYFWFLPFEPINEELHHFEALRQFQLLHYSKLFPVLLQKPNIVDVVLFSVAHYFVHSEFKGILVIVFAISLLLDTLHHGFYHRFHFDFFLFIISAKV